MAQGATTPIRRRRLRSDAERNRGLILEAAGEAFAEHGIGAGVDAIARRAGLGTATLYRHFPTKSALIDAVLEERIATLIAIARASEGVRDMVHRLVDFQIADRSFRDLLAWRDAAHEDDVPAMAELTELMRGVHRRGVESGEVRPEVAYEDVLLLVIALDGASEASPVVPTDALHRLADLTVDGLCAAATEPRGQPAEWSNLRRAATVRR